MEIENLVKKMLIEDPFYGFMLTTLDRRFTTEVQRMGVCFNNSMNAELLINKEFYETLTDTEQLACLKHELLHLAFHHLTMMDMFPNKEYANIAMDLEVNGYIHGLPNWVYKASDYQWPNELGTLEYYRRLTNQEEQQQQQDDSGQCMAVNPDAPCNGGGSPDKSDDESKPSNNNGDNSGEDESEEKQQPKPKTGPQKYEQHDGKQDSKMVCDHSVWKSSSEEQRANYELMNSIINDMLLKSAAAVKNRGTIPAELTEYISELKKPLKRVFDWKKAFRRFMGNSYTENKKTSRRKESRRFSGSAGSKHMKRAHLLVAIDTSASVSNQELHEFVSELTYMHKAGSHIHVIECDAAIHKEYDFKPGCIKDVSGRGGTDFEPVIKYYKDHYRLYETLVLFTDGEAPLDFKVPQDNMLLVISSRGTKQDYPGKVLYIPQTDNQ